MPQSRSPSVKTRLPDGPPICRSIHRLRLLRPTVQPVRTSYGTPWLHPTVPAIRDGDDRPMSTTPAPDVPENPPPDRPVPGRPLEDPPLPGKDNPVIAPGDGKNPPEKLSPFN
jgi:hypothetical protein